MRSTSPWEACRFDATGQLLDVSVHDSFVYAVVADLERGLLLLHTAFRDGAANDLVDLRFVGVVAHHLQDVKAPSILLDVERVEADVVVERWRKLFSARERHGWPIRGVALSDLPRRLDELAVWGYVVMGSTGLDGFVLATAVEHRRREAPPTVD